ncbi:hypothetical protein HDU67_010382 [Dinochytrium kinnereticum]|nr:hypothetical protein HDU67_010382 [Dinochytrium kinnereticum]
MVDASYVRGVVAGVASTLLIEAVLILTACYILFDPYRKTVTPPPLPSASPSSSTDTQEGRDKGRPSLRPRKPTEVSNEHEEPWPDNIVEFLTAALDPLHADAFTGDDQADFFDEPDPALDDEPMEDPPAVSSFRLRGRRNSDPATPLSGISSFLRQPSPSSRPTPAPKRSRVAKKSAPAVSELSHILNVIGHRFFLSLRDSQMFKDRIKERTSEKMNLKLQNNSFVSHVKICDLSMGDHPPKIQGLRLIKGLAEDLAVTLEMDLTYTGGGSVAIEATLTRGLSMTARVYLSGFAGKLRIRIPDVNWSDMLSVAFVEDPGLTFMVDAPITMRENEIVRGMINRVLAGMMRKDELARQIAINNARSPVTKRQGPKSLGASLWERRMALSKVSKTSQPFAIPSTSISSPSPAFSGVFPDALSAHAFPVTVSIDFSIDPRLLDGPLVTAFLSLSRKRPRSLLPIGTATSGDEAIAGSGGTGPEDVDTMEWRTVKNKAGIVLQKRRVVVGSSSGEVTRARVNVKGDVERIYAILSNPDHLKCLDDGFLETEVIAPIGKYASVRRSTFLFSKGNIRDTLFLEARGSLRDLHRNAKVTGSFDLNASSAYVIVLRSIGEIRDSTTDPLASPLGNSEDLVEAEDELMIPRKNAPKEPALVEDANPAIMSTTPTPASNDLEGYVTAAGPPEILPISEIPKPSSDLKLQPSDDPKPSSPNLYQKAAERLPLTSNPKSKRKVASIYVYGYLIEPSYLDATSCTVTILSQMGPEISRLDLDFGACRRIKAYIETLMGGRTAGLTNLFASNNGASSSGIGIAGAEGVRRRVFAGGAVSAMATAASGSGAGGGDSEKRIDKLKNLVSSTASYLMRNRRVSANLSASSAPSISPRTSSLVESASADSPVDSERSEYAAGGFEDEVDDNRSGTLVGDLDSMMVDAVDPDSSIQATINDNSLEPPLPHLRSSTVIAHDIDPIKPHLFPAKPISGQPFIDPSSSRGGRGFGFLRRGGGGAASPYSPPSESRPTSFENIDDTHAFSEAKLEGRGDVFRYTTPHRPSSTGVTEMVVEFNVDGDHFVGFGCEFIAEEDLLAPERRATLSDRTIFPHSIVYSHPTRMFRAIVSSGMYPKGCFNFSWDTTPSSTKKATKTLRYRVAFRSALLPPTVSKPLRGQRTVVLDALVGMARSGGHFIGYSSDVLLQRKSACRLDIPVEPLVGTGVSFLAWEVGIGCYDFSFSILFTPFEEGEGDDGDFEEGKVVTASSLVAKPSLASRLAASMTTYDGALPPASTSLKFVRGLKSSSVPQDLNPAESHDLASSDASSTPSISVSFAPNVGGGGGGGGGGSRIVGRLRGRSLPNSPTPKQGVLNMKPASVVVFGPIKVTAKGDRVGGVGVSSSNDRSGTTPGIGSGVSSALGISQVNHLAGGVIQLSNSGGVCSGWLPLFSDEELEAHLGRGHHFEHEGERNGSDATPPEPSLASTSQGFVKRPPPRLFGSRPGVFTFVLDNTHSVVLSKTVTARVGVRSLAVSSSATLSTPPVSPDRHLFDPTVTTSVDVWEERREAVELVPVGREVLELDPGGSVEFQEGGGVGFWVDDGSEAAEAWEDARGTSIVGVEGDVGVARDDDLTLDVL